MPVRIIEILAKQLGPVSDFSMKPGLINLIYGQNEQGKTHLVEFLIRSLFRKHRSWPLRKTSGTGKVWIDGLTGGKEVFSPSGKTKLEDFWDQSAQGLPPFFNRLLVVKGAELEFSDQNDGLGKEVFKRYLSNQELLDSIEKRISKTVLEAVVEEKNITGPMRGEIKTRDDLSMRLEKLETLFEQIDRGYTGGALKQLIIRLEELQKSLADMEQAKRFAASQIASQREKIQQDKSKIDESLLKSVGNDLVIFHQMSQQVRQKSRQQKEAAEAARHYGWLSKAVTFYRDQFSSTRTGSIWIWSAAAVLSLIASAVLIWFQKSVYALAGIGLTGILVGLGFYFYRKSILNLPNSREISTILDTYHSRFGEKATSLADMEVQLEKMAFFFETARVLTDLLKEEKRRLDDLETQIADQIFRLTAEKHAPDDWPDVILGIETRLRDLNQKIVSYDRELDRLDVSPQDYLEDDPGLAYDRHAHEKLFNEVSEIKRAVQEHNTKLEQLKQKICEITGDAISIPWEQLIQNLRETHLNCLAEYKDLTAEILGKKAVQRILDQLRLEEDRKIDAGLSSELILQPLKKITGRYTNLELKDNELMISDAWQNFPFSELSTGAQEQVLLALRIGFAQKWLRREADQLFLILDDAFQYSDWSRREYLLDMVIELAKSGWQILYFTMDDHIRDLFDTRCVSFGDQYVLKSL